jgi:hypothetical protein
MILYCFIFVIYFKNQFFLYRIIFFYYLLYMPVFKSLSTSKTSLIDVTDDLSLEQLKNLLREEFNLVGDIKIITSGVRVTEENFAEMKQKWPFESFVTVVGSAAAPATGAPTGAPTGGADTGATPSRMTSLKGGSKKRRSKKAKKTSKNTSKKSSKKGSKKMMGGAKRRGAKKASKKSSKKTSKKSSKKSSKKASRK